ncbi:LPS assembly lipoprotein LptE [Neolewinella antarctica]|uniref:Lipopolysaccharide-assembly n=1 Tax=Neolewinella antarctica TaxID=442734 RepID=A0ABX0X7Y6_9BACT|nr:LPS assembly lipoprotein LptE [Neolewinella antarctica]NJC25350.1 hypothetical protein [Neolewinella antarctica]
MMKKLFLLSLVALLFVACYSFRGISIPDGVESAYIPIYLDNAIGAPPTLHQDMTEELRNKVRDEARLTIVESNPDIQLEGTLVDFRVSAEGARPGDQTSAIAALNRLTIVVAISYTNLLDESGEDKWKQNFSQFFDFPASQTLASVQDEAIEEIVNDINEKIFNKAFAEEW